MRGLEQFLNAEDIAGHVDPDAVLMAEFPGMVLENRSAAINGVHIVETGPLYDLLAFVAADATVIGLLVYGIVTAAAVAGVKPATTDVNIKVKVDFGFGFSLLNRGKGGKGNSNSCCSDKGLGNHLFSPGFEFRFVVTTTLAIDDTETNPPNLNAIRRPHSFSVHFENTRPL
jgi:hypothetical protein